MRIVGSVVVLGICSAMAHAEVVVPSEPAAPSPVAIPVPPHGTLEISCDAPSGDITIDNQAAFACPTRQPLTITLDVGRHTVTLGATTEAIDITANVRMAAILHGATEGSRFPNWLPWLAVASGVVLATGGFLIAMKGASDNDNVDASIAAQCSEHACTGPQLDALERQRDSADRTFALGIGTGIVGAAAVLGGIIVFALNDPVPGGPQIRFSPSTTPLQVAWRF